jgi:F-type H+-transporting ATPase subunit b
MKIRNIVIVALLLAPVVALASGAGHHIDPEATRYFKLTGRVDDFWQRVINFSIFAGLVYYLTAGPISAFFKGRQADIASQLKEIKDKLQASKDEEKEAEARVIASEAKAKELVADSQEEAKILVENIAKKNEEALAVLDRSLEEKMELESKKMAKDVINKLLVEGISNDDIAVDESKVVSLVSKKVA